MSEAMLNRAWSQAEHGGLKGRLIGIDSADPTQQGHGCTRYRLPRLPNAVHACQKHGSTPPASTGLRTRLHLHTLTCQTARVPQGARGGGAQRGIALRTTTQHGRTPSAPSPLQARRRAPRGRPSAARAAATRTGAAGAATKRERCMVSRGTLVGLGHASEEMYGGAPTKARRRPPV